MLVSKKWLEQFIDIPSSVTPKEIAEKLTLSTVEVEGIRGQAAGLDHIVVGKIISVEKHPNADRLRVCRVDVSEIKNQKSITAEAGFRPHGGKVKSQVQIVCGGSNIREGMLVAVALPGAAVRWHGEGEPMTLAKTSIRGVESFGMICAADEIGLGERFPKKEEKEILDISESRIQNSELSKLNDVVGKHLAEVLGGGDVVFDIDNKSMTHRADLWGHYGMAREIAALFDVRLKDLKIEKIREGTEMMVEVQVQDAVLCPRYMAVAMTDIVVAPSPKWMRERLQSVGMRPVNNVVDVTNYVMLETGQPLHAFDAERLTRNPATAGSRSRRDKEHGTRNNVAIVVRKAKSGEKILLLDGKERTLTNGMLVIADERHPIAIAGVMGSKGSGVTEKTKTIILEAANFEAGSIRKTSTALGIRSESSARFEKGLDPTLPPIALVRAVEFLRELCPVARVASAVEDRASFPRSIRSLTLEQSFIQKKLGVAISAKEAAENLIRLGFGVKIRRGSLHVRVPSYRAGKDVAIPEDLVEEIARLYGYNNIPASLPSFSIAPPAENLLCTIEHRVRETLALECRATEVYNYSFVSPEWLERIGIDTKEHMELDNPIAKDRPLLRRSVIPGLLENTEANLHRFDKVRLFEIGRVYRRELSGPIARHGTPRRLPGQPTLLGIAVAEKGNGTPFYVVSGMIAALFSRLGVAYRLEKQSADDAPFLHAGRNARIVCGKDEVGKIAELHPDAGERLGMLARTAIAELNLEILLPHAGQTHSVYHSVPLYPPVFRDIAFVVDTNVEHAAVAAAIRRVDPLVVSAELFDVYTGLNAGKKSMAYHIAYQSPDHTLSSDEADAAHDRVAAFLAEQFGAVVRS